MITCPNCGASVEAGKRFCPECGTRMEISAEQLTSTPGANDPNNIPPTTPVRPTTSGASDPTIQLNVPPVNVPPVTPQAPQIDDAVAPTQRLDAPPPVSPNVPPPFSRSDANQGNAYSVPPIPVANQPAQPGRSNRTLWIVLGSVGCLGVVAIAACIGALALFGVGASNGIDAFATTFATALAETPVAGAPTATLGRAQATPVIGDTPTDQTTDDPTTVAASEGEVLLEDDFSSPAASEFSTDEDETASYTFQDGAYLMTVQDPNYVVWSLTTDTYDDAAIQIDTVQVAGTTLGAAGLIFHYQDDTNFYLYSVSDDGYYSLDALVDNEWTPLIEWTPSNLIQSEGNTNTMRVETRDDQIALFVNDMLVEETSDSTFSSGEAGLAVSTFEEGGTQITFDNLRIETVQ